MQRLLQLLLLALALCTLCTLCSAEIPSPMHLCVDSGDAKGVYTELRTGEPKGYNAQLTGSEWTWGLGRGKPDYWLKFDPDPVYASWTLHRKDQVSACCSLPPVLCSCRCTWWWWC